MGTVDINLTNVRLNNSQGKLQLIICVLRRSSSCATTNHSVMFTLMNVYMRETWAMEKDHQCLHFRASWPAVAVLTLLIQISGLIVPGCE